VRSVATEEEAAAFIAEMKKKYWDARHNCSAFVIGDNNEITRCSDDGEPAQTAGRPMLEILLGEELHNVAVVVTRYFGGVLLGTGGLVRAYQSAVREGLNNCDIADVRQGIELIIDTDYNGLGKLQYIMASNGWNITDTQYTEKVQLTCLIPEPEIAKAQNEITDATGGTAGIAQGRKLMYGLIDGKIIFN
jgi:uncharacterized YigZ family protein